MAYIKISEQSVKAHNQSQQSYNIQHNNSALVTKGGRIEAIKTTWNFFFNKPDTTVPSGQIPVQPLTRAQLLAAQNNTVYRLGHSSVLLKLHDVFWITDPVFSERASPISFAGPKRFHQPPISIEELPPIKGVIISHDHYDHLDHDTIMKLAEKAEYFLTPLGVGDIIISWGMPAAKVRQLDWWQATDVDTIRFVATPAHHFSGRGLINRNSTLWASWVILAADQRFFFSGDTGYFDGFKKIGDKYGPFDLAMLETGAYNENWPGVHMQPEETIQAYIDLKGRNLLPIHNSTFDLSMHAWHEPLDRIVSLANAKGVPVVTPRMGEPVDLQHTKSWKYWWVGVDAPNGAALVQIKPQTVTAE